MKKWVMDTLIEALNLTSRADLESTMDKCSDKGSESGGPDSKHLKQRRCRILNFLETSDYLHVSDLTLRKSLYQHVLTSTSKLTS